MKPPYLSDGATYCTDSNGNRICTGSRMGRATEFPADRTATHKLHLRRVPMVDYCYDQGGAYWGGPANLFCAWGEEVSLYTRAPSRAEAKRLVLAQLPAARFYR